MSRLLLAFGFTASLCFSADGSDSVPDQGSFDEPHADAFIDGAEGLDENGRPLRDEPLPAEQSTDPARVASPRSRFDDQIDDAVSSFAGESADNWGDRAELPVAASCVDPYGRVVLGQPRINLCADGATYEPDADPYTDHLIEQRLPPLRHEAGFGAVATVPSASGYGSLAAVPYDRGYVTATHAGARLRCESRQQRTASCPIPIGARVSLIAQHSARACIEGHSWGVVADAVWVSRGCRASFWID